MKISQTVFNLQSGHEYMMEMAMFNVQRAITPNIDKVEPRFICPARCLMMLYIRAQFRENITNGIRIMERTQVHGRNGYVQCSKGNNSKSRQTRVMVHVFCTSSHSALHCRGVSWKYLKRNQIYGADKKLWSADGRTQNFGRYNIIPRHFLWRSIITGTWI